MMNAICALIEHGVFESHAVTVFYTYGLRKIKPSPDSTLFEKLSSKGVRLIPLIIPTDSRPFQYKKKEGKNYKESFTIFLKDFIGSVDVWWKLRVMNGEFDVLWVNQLPYYRILRLKARYKLLFARELFFSRGGDAKRLFNRVADENAMTLAISNMTAKAFFEEGLQKVKVIRNPVSMDSARRIRDNVSMKEEIKIHYGLGAYEHIVVMVGNITPPKGTEFFLDIAERFNEDVSYIFLIVGGGRSTGNTEYYNSVIGRILSMGNVRVIDAMHDEMQRIYGIVSLVIRTDSFFPMGRTVYEGVFAGTPVLLPFNEDDDISEIKPYLDRQVFLYHMRNLEHAVSMVREVSSLAERFVPIAESNNYAEYAESIKSCLDKYESLS